MENENEKITIFLCKRGRIKSKSSNFVDIRLKAERRLFEKFKGAIEKNSEKKGHNIHDLFNTFMKGYVSESKSS